MTDESEQPAFLELDFVRYYPDKFWISDWAKDATYPEGFRYKVLSARDENEDTVEIVLLLQARNGTKEDRVAALAPSQQRGQFGVFALETYTACNPAFISRGGT